MQVRFRGGPRDGETDATDVLPSVIGDGTDGGVYQRTEETQAGATVYVWQALTPSEAIMLVNRNSAAE